MTAIGTAAAEPGGTKSKVAFALEAGVKVHRGVGTHIKADVAVGAHHHAGVVVHRGFHRKPPVVTVPGHRDRFITPAEARRVHAAKVRELRRSPRIKAAGLDRRHALKHGVLQRKKFAAIGHRRLFGHRRLSHRQVFFGQFPGRLKGAFGRR